MSKFTITPTVYDSQVPSKDPILNGRIYMCIQIDSGHPDIPCQISGWVRPEVAALVKAAPDLLEALIDLGDWLAYGLNKAAGADPTAEDHAACERVAAKARAAVTKATVR